MKLLELHIEEFGPLKNLSLKLGEGLTVIHGDNESGKSTILLFIKFMLYGLPKRGSVERERAISRDGHRAAGRLLLWDGAEIYQINRSVIEGRRGTERVSVTRVRDGEPFFTDEIPGEALLGVSREIFESSCCVGQMMCGGISGKKESVAIQNLLSSADETVEIDKIVGKLEDIRVRYRYKKGSGGKLYELETKIQAEKQRMDRATENQLRRAELSERLSTTTEQLRFCEEKLREAETVEKEIAKLEVLRRFDALRDNERKAERIRDERAELTRLERKTEYSPTAVDVSNLRLLAEGLKRAETALERAEEALSQTETRSVDRDRIEQAKRLESASGRESVLAQAAAEGRRAKVGQILTAVGGVLAGSGVAAFFLLTLPVSLILSGVGALTLIPAILLWITGKNKLKALGRTWGANSNELNEHLCLCETELATYREIEKERMERETAEASAREQERNARRMLLEALLKTDANATATVEAAWEEMRRLDAYLSKDRLLEQQETVLKQLVENDRRILSPYQEDELRESLALPTDFSSADMEQVRRERGAYAEKVRLLRNLEEQLRNEVISRGVTGEDPMEIADRLSALREELSADIFYYEALESALEGIRQAGEAMRGNLTPVISKNAGGIMEYISNGRYEQMRVAGTMNLSLVERNQEDTSAELLSGGTRDAAYISLRIALMMQIFGDALPPLMLDETLCQVDDSRMRRILTLLAKLSETRLQCILFTCHNREVEACRAMGLDFEELSLNEPREI